MMELRYYTATITGHTKTNTVTVMLGGHVMDKAWYNYKTTPEEVAKVQDVLTREAYRRFKQCNRSDMAVVLARVYHLGMEDAAKQIREQMPEEEEIRMDWDAIMDEIRSVKGIGTALADRIDAAVTGRFAE